MTFKQALAEVYGSFGVTGFYKVLAAKESSVSKEAIKIWFKEFFSWFKWPKMLITTAFFYLLWQLLHWTEPIYIVYGLMLIYFIIVGYYHFYRKRHATVKKEYSLLTLQTISTTGFFLSWMPFYCAFIAMPLPFFDDPDSLNHPIIAVAILALSLLFFTGGLSIFPRFNKRARQMYPEAFAT